MPKQIQKAEVNSFLGGLITEASPLNFPPNAMSNGQNFELNRDGSITRRLGMDFEPGYQLNSTGYTSDQIGQLGYNTYSWYVVAGNSTLNFVVMQVGQKLFFFNANVLNFSTSLVGSVTLSQFSQNAVYSMADVEGRLAIVSGSEQIAIVTYNSAANTFSISYNRLLVRDLWGVEETEIPLYETDPSYRSAAYSALHRYNLVNQSWGIPRRDPGANLADPIRVYSTNLAVNPSNSEQVWPALQLQAVSLNQMPFQRIFPNLWEEVLGAKSATAKGYFIIDALQRGSSRVQALAANSAKYPVLSFSAPLPIDYTPGGPTCITSFAGRFWYAGFTGTVVGGDQRSPNYANYVFFSQLVKNTEDAAKCHQQGDPTSKDSSDLLDTDGGFIRIAGAQQIITMRQLGISLFVFATNGVWTITGNTIESGFTATNYKVSQLSSFGIISVSSLIVEGIEAYYWAKDGIYKVGRNQFGDYTVTSMTLATIQKLYRDIDNISKQNSFGEYDEYNKKLRWVYTTGTPFDVSQQNNEIVFDTALNAFTHNVIANTATNNTMLAGLFKTRVIALTPINDNVNIGTVAVVTNAGDQVAVPSTIYKSNPQYLRYFALVSSNGSLSLTVSYYYNSQWLDWFSFDNRGTDAFAFLETGGMTGGDSSLNKQVPYLTMSFLRTETGTDSKGNPINPSSCMMRMMWNWSNEQISGQWSQFTQVYRYRKLGTIAPTNPYDTGYSVLQTKNKVRGKGRSFALHLETQPGYDCKILGWNVGMTVNSAT